MRQMTHETGNYCDYVDGEDVIRWMINRLTLNANKKYGVKGTLRDIIYTLEKKGKYNDIMQIEFAVQNIRQKFQTLPRNEYNLYIQMTRA